MGMRRRIVIVAHVCLALIAEHVGATAATASLSGFDGHPAAARQVASWVSPNSPWAVNEIRPPISALDTMSEVQRFGSFG